MFAQFMCVIWLSTIVCLYVHDYVVDLWLTLNFSMIISYRFNCKFICSDVAYVTSSGSIIAVAGYSSNSVNVVIWDTLAPPTTSRASILCHEGLSLSLSVTRWTLLLTFLSC